MSAMVILEDGPARQAPGLLFARTPLFLRVVQEASGRWDGLDLLDDEANPGDTIHVYRRTTDAGWVCGRGKGSHNGRVLIYRHVLGFPTAGLEDRERWQAAVRTYVEHEAEVDQPIGAGVGAPGNV